MTARGFPALAKPDIAVSSGAEVASSEREASALEPPPAWAMDLLEGSGLAPFMVLEGAKITYVSPALLELVGWGAAGATPPTNLYELIGDKDCERMLAKLAQIGVRHRDICALRQANRAEAYMAFEAATIQTALGPRTVLLASDVTAWIQGQARLQRLAFHDALTGLANRVHLYDRAEQAIAAARRTGGAFAILLVDLDQFKPINDIHGHAVGDLVLREAAHRIQAAAREVDTVARLGGDEFVVLLAGVGDRVEARLVAERIIEAVTTPLAVRGLRLGVSVGIAMYPEDGSSVDQLLACADGAMYEAKHRGGNRHAFSEGWDSGSSIGARNAWSPRYLIGIDRIDAQHEELVCRMHDLWEALRAGRDRTLLSRGLTEMTCLLQEHFATEEAYMAALPYPGSAAHRADHAYAIEIARSLAVHVDERSLALGIRFIYDWLLSHIRSYDAELPRPT